MVKELAMDLLEVMKARRSIRMFAKKVPSKKIIQELLDGVAVGYPLKGSPLNAFPRTRIPVEDVTTWLGF